jgi:CRP/FNR family transcriptional regulator
MDSKGATSAALLDALPPKARERLLKNTKRRTYAAGDAIVHEGDSALYLYIVDTGHGRIEQVDRGVVGRFGPGDFFGELALLDQGDRTATVIAEDELTCYLIPAWEFRALLHEHPAMAIPMLHKVIARLHGR